MKKDFKDSSYFKQLSAEQQEIEKLKWIESEKEHEDIGIHKAVIIWVRKYRINWLKNREK